MHRPCNFILSPEKVGCRCAACAGSLYSDGCSTGFPLSVSCNCTSASVPLPAIRTFYCFSFAQFVVHTPQKILDKFDMNAITRLRWSCNPQKNRAIGLKLFICSKARRIGCFCCLDLGFFFKSLSDGFFFG